MIVSKGRNVYWLALLTALIMLLPGDIRDVLYLDFERVMNGEIWRAISGHLTHLSWTHWLLNIAGLMLLQQFYSQYFSTWHWLGALVFIMLAVSIGLLTFSEELKWYGGLSGVLIGLFYISAINDYQHKKIFNALALAGLSLYIFIQQLLGERIEGLANSVTVATRAHLLGAIAGLLWLLLAHLWSKLNHNR